MLEKTQVNWLSTAWRFSVLRKGIIRAPRPTGTGRHRPLLFRPCSGWCWSAPPNDANQRALKSQVSGMIAGTATGAKSSSSTPTGLELRHSGNSTATASRYH